MSGGELQWLDVPRMAAEPPPAVPWLVERVIPRAALTVLYAPGGDGKSLLAMALAASIAHGEELAGIGCEKGLAVYLDGENGPAEIHRRIHTLGLPAYGVKVADAGGLDLRRDMGLVEQVLELDQPDLLVLDSFRALHPGMGENDTAATAGALDRLRRLAHGTAGTAILLIHHANKGGRDFRGASSSRAGVDVFWHLGRADGDPDPRRRFLHNRKMRPAADGARLWLRLEVDRGRVLVDQADPHEPEPPERAPVRVELSAACLAAMNGQPMTLAAIVRAVGRQPKDGSVRNALTALARDGDVVKRADGQWSRGVQGAKPLGGVAPLHPAPGRPEHEVARAERALADHPDLAA